MMSSKCQRGMNSRSLLSLASKENNRNKANDGRHAPGAVGVGAVEKANPLLIAGHAPVAGRIGETVLKRATKSIEAPMRKTKATWTFQVTTRPVSRMMVIALRTAHRARREAVQPFSAASPRGTKPLALLSM